MVKFEKREINTEFITKREEELKELENSQPKKIEKAGGMAQVAECLPNKCKVLSSTPSTTKKRREREKVLKRKHQGPRQ
jgi:hypothetical protein